MKITKISPLTGASNTMDLPCTQAQIDRWLEGHGLIQNVLPQLTAEQREFLKTGFTPDDWEKMFPPEEDE